MRIRFIVYPQFDLLDLSGPLAVFADANALVDGSYELEVVSATGGEITSHAGVTIASKKPGPRRADTVLMLGGTPQAFRAPTAGTLKLLERSARNASRIASVCTGAFFLGEIGLLDGIKATTHWHYAPELQARFPACRVDSDKIFIREGAIWTSAGVTAGIDLALAMVEDDLGLQVSRQVARGLVVFQRRLGGQSQYSTLLEFEAPSDRIRRVMTHAKSHLHQPLSVQDLAEVANLSPRQFTRAFTAETGTSPAKAVERLRAEAARPMVEESRTPLDDVARLVGFTDSERMRQAFIRAFGQPPQALRRHHRSSA